MTSKFFCEKCNYRSNNRACFNQHLITTLHITGKRKERSDKVLYTCVECNYSEYNKNNFLSHNLNNHSTIEERKEKFKYYCEVCNIGVFVKSMMDTHFKTIKHQFLFNKAQTKQSETNV